MPIFSINGKDYNVREADVAKLAVEHPDAFTVGERDGAKYRVSAKDYSMFMSPSGTTFAPTASHAPEDFLDADLRDPAQVEQKQLEEREAEFKRDINRFGVDNIPSIKQPQQPAPVEQLQKTSLASLVPGPMGTINSLYRSGANTPTPEAEQPAIGDTDVYGEEVDTTDYAVGFGEGTKEGWKGLVAGTQYFGGELANAITGTSRDDWQALQELQRRYYEGESLMRDEVPGWKKAWMKYVNFNSLIPESAKKGYRQILESDNINSLINDALVAANGDVTQARKILAEQSLKETWGDRQIETAGEKLETIRPTKGFGAWAGNLIPQMIPTAAALGAGFLTKNPKVAQTIGQFGMGVMTASTAGMSMKEARDAGATNGEVWAAGIADGVIEYVSEKIPFDIYTRKIAKNMATSTSSDIIRLLGDPKSPAKDELEKLVVETNKRLGGKLLSGRNVKEYLTSVAAEGLSEFSAEALQTMTPIIYEDPENYPTLWDALKNGVEGFKAGIFMGAIMGGGSKAMEHQQQRSRRKQQGYVAVAQIDTDNGSSVGEVVGEKDGKIIALVDGDFIEVAPENVGTVYEVPFEAFDKGVGEYEIEESYENGYTLQTPQEKNDARTMLEEQRKRVIEIMHLPEDTDLDEYLGDDPLRTILMMEEGTTQGERQALLDYVNAASTVDGMYQAVRDDIDGKIAQSDAQVDSRISQTDGRIHPATMKQDDRAVYIMSGEVVLLDDGTIDTAKSTESIIVKDAETGKMEFSDPASLLNVGEVADAEQTKEALREQIRQSVAGQAEAEILGTLAFAQGDTYVLTDEEGVQYQAQIVADNGDGTVQVALDGATEAVQMPKEQVQAMNDATNRSRAAAYIEQQNAQRESAMQEVAEEQQPIEQPQEPQVEEQPQAPVIPTLKDGSPDYNAMDADMFTEQSVANFGEDVTERVARNNIADADKVIASTRKQLDSVTDPNKIQGIYSKLTEAEQRRKKYVDVLDRLGLSEDANETADSRRDRLKQNATPRIAQMFPEGLPNVEAVILADIANGQKIRWSDKVVNGAVVSKGLGAELGLANVEDERKRRIGIIGKDAPTPEEYAESLRERLDAMGIRYEESELRDKVIEMYSIADTRRAAWAELENIAASAAAQEDVLNYEEEQMRRAYERGNANAQTQQEQVEDSQPEDAEIPTPEEYDSIAKEFEGTPAVEETQVEEVAEQTQPATEQTEQETQAEAVPTQEQTEQEEQKQRKQQRVRIKVKKDEEARRKPLRKRAQAWAKKVGVEAVIIERFEDVENESARKAIQMHEEQKSGQRIPGWYSGGKVYIYLPHATDISDLDQTYIHEVVAHHGMKQMLGEEGYKQFCLKVWDMMEQTLTERELNRWLAYQGVKGDKAKAADEYIAHLAETTESLTELDQSVWDKIVELLRDALRQLGVSLEGDAVAFDPSVEFTNKLIVDALHASKRNLKQTAKTATTKEKAKTATPKAQKVSDPKIEDFGEKIGGARKDVARGRLRDTAKLSMKDLTTLKDPDKILSRKDIVKFMQEGLMTEQDAMTLMALNAAARSKWTIRKGQILQKYRDVALQWERGEQVKVEVTDAEIDAYLADMNESWRSQPNAREKAQAALLHSILVPFEAYHSTYEKLNYPSVYRNLKGTVIKEYHSGKYFVQSELGARRGRPFNSLQQAIDYVEKAYPVVSMELSKPKSGKADSSEKVGHLHVVKDSLYGYRIKSRSIPGNIFLSGRFKTKAEAEAYLQENAETLRSREEQMTFTLMGSDIGAVERSGVDYRQGRDITPEEFQSTFGFRGVEFGNWVPQAERQLYLNKTYDAIMDFCKVVGISPKAFSLGGQLALAFGSRGKSKAIAHYEPMKMAINLTRMNGAGSLAHEWFHALDNYLARQATGNALDMATDKRRAERDIVANTFSQLVRRMATLDYSTRSRNAGAYWNEVWERAARLFETYVYNELGGQQTISPLLVRETTLFDDTLVEDFGQAYPYPSAEENAIMKPYFDALFGALEERTDEQGNSILFRSVENDKARQFAIIERSNPMLDDYHTGIRSVEDIRTFDEAVAEARTAAEQGGWEELASYPDITNDMLEEAKQSGRITIYSSKPIANGTFVTPSLMQASDYAGGEEVYSKVVRTSDVAWINTDEGQMAASEDVRFRFIGEQGAANLDKADEATTRLDNLAVARQMEVEQKDAKTIKMATGWERGADGKWRYETLDDITSETIDRLEKAGEISFEELLGEDHPLLKAYPTYKNGMIAMRPFSDGEFGSTDVAIADGRTIPIIEVFNHGTIENIKTLTHELQHVVQLAEGFAVGGNALEQASDFDNVLRELNKLLPVVVRNTNQGTIDQEQVRNDLEGITFETADVQDLLDWVLSAEQPTEEEFATKWNELSKTSDKKRGDEKFDKYHRLAGETEARNVETRMGYTMDERRASLASETADVAREDQIFIYDALAGNTSFRTTYHGTPATFERFDHSFMGSGEGNRVFGWGTYVTEEKGIGEWYATVLTDPINEFSPERRAIIDAQIELDKAERFAESLREEIQFAKDDIAFFEERIRNGATGYELEEAQENIEYSKENTLYNEQALKNAEAKIESARAAVAQAQEVYESARVRGNVYQVEIPDDNGHNYLSWEGRLTPKQMQMIASQAEKEGLTDLFYRDEDSGELVFNGSMTSGEFEYKGLERSLGSDKAASEFLSRAGFTGIMYFGDGGNQDVRNYVIFNDADLEIKERTSFRTVPTFLSNAAVALEGIKQEKATPKQWLAMLKKAGGIKAGEDKWIGLSEWLEQSEAKTLTKQEVADFINENQIQIEEVKYSEFEADLIDQATEKLDAEMREIGIDAMREKYPDFDNYFELFDGELVWSENNASEREYEDYIIDKHILDVQEAINETRLGYTTDGLDNKREIALTVPTIESWNEGDLVHFGDAGEGRAIAWIRFGETTDSDGKRVLVIDEIQSERHQEGREKGYRPSDVDKYLKDNNVEVVETGEFYEFYRDGELDRRFSKGLLHYNIKAAKNLYVAGYEKSDIPEAPFEKNWAELAMKRMLRYAAEHGFDKVAWTKGDQQAERYSIGGVISKIGKNESNNIDEQNFEVGLAGAESMLYLTTDNDGNIIHSLASEYVGRTLSEVFGKELAVKMLNAKENTAIEGDGLRIGGEGMRAFYDQMLPSFMRKYAKKWGATVQDVTLPNVEEAGRTMHSVDVTDSMRESVMQGQTMFRVADAKKLFKELEERYEKLDKSDTEALNKWRDEKAAAIQSVLTAISDELNLECPIIVFNGENEDSMQEVYGYIKAMYDEVGKKFPYSYEKFRERVSKKGNLGKYWRYVEIVTSNTSNYDYLTDYQRAIATLMHENAHHIIRKSYTNGDLEAIWDEAVSAKHPLVLVVEKFDSSRTNAGKGNELLSRIIGDITSRKGDDVIAYIKGEKNVEQSLLKNSGYSLPLGRFALSEILNTFKNDYRRRGYQDLRGGSRLGFSHLPGGHTTNRIRRKAVKEAAELFASQLGTPINIVERISDITDPNPRLQSRKRVAKGWYDAITKQVVVVLPNAVSVEDVRATIFHEVVGHKGMRETVGEKRYNAFLEKVYRGASQTIRERIARRASTLGWDFNLATDEYLASLAEQGFEERENRNFFEVVRDLFLDLLSDAKIVLGYRINDNDIRYMLWRTYQMQRSKGAMGIAEDMVMQQKLGVGNFAPNDTRFRVAENDSLTKRVSDIMEEYDDSEEIFTIGDVADRIEELLNEYDGHESTTTLENILNDYRDAQSGANRYGHRWDSGGEEAFEDAIRLFASQQATPSDDVRMRVAHTPYRETLIRQQYEERIKSGMYQSMEAMQDSMQSLHDTMLMILKEEGYGDMYIEDVASFENAYIGENRLSSTNLAEANAFANTVFQRLVDAIAAIAPNEEARTELIDYMFAKHGLERNEKMAEREAKREYDQQESRIASKAISASGAKTMTELITEKRQKDYAGLTALTGKKHVSDAEKEAQRMVEEYENSHETDEIWERVQEVRKAILSKLYEGGLLSKEQMEQILDMYDYYIPLRGFDEKTVTDQYAYLTSTRGSFSSPIRKAGGRESKADDPFANLSAMAESAILQANRNMLVKQRFLNFVLRHPSDLVSVNRLWLRYDEANQEWVPEMPNILETDSPDEVARKVAEHEQAMKELSKAYPDRYKVSGDQTSMPYKVPSKETLKEHQVIVKRNGVDYVLTINGSPRLAQALNGLTNPDNDISGAIGAVLDAAQWVNRALSAAYTTRNPDFLLSNFMRDMLYTNTMVWVKESPNYALAFHKNYLKANPAQMKILYSKYREGTLDMSDPMEAMFYKFVINGGETGYVNLKDVEQHKSELKKLLARSGGQLSVQEGWQLLGDRLDEFNQAVENCARFAAFMTSQQMGRSVDRSIYDAKEISVNFNKKGAGSKFMGANGQTALGNTAAFTSGLGRAMYVFWNAAIQGTANFGRQAKRHPAKAFTAVASWFVLGALMAYLGYDDDDEDAKNSYFNNPEYVRRSNIMFHLGDGHYAKIPLPIEARAAYGLGELMVSVMSGKEDYSDGELASAIVGQMTQILPLDFMEGQGGFHAFIPSSVKPVTEIVSNTSWTGLPIYKDNPYNKDMPNWTKAYSGTNKYLVNLAATLNELSGGDKYTKGAIDLNPANIEYFLNGYFGGYFATADKLTKTAEMVVGARDFDPRGVLFLNRMLAKSDDRTQYRAVNNKYYEAKKEYETTKRRLRNYEHDTDEGIFNFAEKIDFLYNSEAYRRMELFDIYRGDIEDLEREIKDATSDEEKEALNAELMTLKSLTVDAIYGTEEEDDNDSR